MAIALDLDLTAEDVSRLTSADVLAAFFQRLGYSTSKRAVIPPQAVGLDGLSDIRHIELISEDAEGFLRVLFVHLRSVTAKSRNTLVRTFGQQNQDYLLVLTSDFEALEFVLIEKVRHRRKGPGGDSVTKPLAKVFVVPRRWPQNMLRIVRRLTFTARDEKGQPDGILQYAKLVSVFDAAHYSGEYFQNRALFADHYLRTRLPEDPAWSQPANEAFAAVSTLMRQARDRLGDKDEATARHELFEPLFKVLDFAPQSHKKSNSPDPQPDYHLPSLSGQPRTVALVYAWERWLDGPDAADPDTANENPGAAVVTLLERGDADWVIVSNGKLWRLYSRNAHSRSTNFYEVDLEDALLATGQTDPNEAFRYWWLFFRETAFAAVEERDGKSTCWLDRIAAGSRDYAREVEAELKRRVFYEVVPQLAAGFLEDRRTRLKDRATPTDVELEQIREGTLTLLYRLLFLLYAESRDLLPVRESAYYEISVKKLKEEIAESAGVAETDADARLAAGYKRTSTAIYDRLAELFAVMDGGDLKRNRLYNVPVYNGGLFRIRPQQDDAADERETRIARFLLEHKVPDVFLAVALDRLSRVEDQKRFALVFVDYKSLGVRQLGSIYEGLLEFRLKVADEDLPPVSERGRRRATRLTGTRGTRDRTGVKKGEPYLANDKSERKATGSYYTPDHIVQYIVEHTVGPVLRRKLDALRPDFRDAGKTYHDWLTNAQANPRLLSAQPPSVKRTPAKAQAPSDVPHKWTDEDFRTFALDRTLEKHQGLVEKLFDLKVLDPAMGSGHFLVEAVDFITDEILHFLNAFPANPVTAAMARTRASILESLVEQGIETDALLEKQLTDVHLIKRHVLKRCIYGVDLNPLATELAKVSLWLDAFTIGAPLSFLDHHVRTGNSLIGSSVAELDTVLFEQMFKIDYEPMRRAIRDVLLVARSADATAAEAHRSAENFARARQWLSGYRIVLDVLVAKRFGVKLIERLTMAGTHLDLSNRQRFEGGLDDHERRLLREAETLVEQRRFFHWDLEFPEAFYQPAGGIYDSGAGADANFSQAIERKPPGAAGFDAIVGNPPYVRQEALKADKDYLKTAFASTFDAANDLYVYFMQREIELLKSGGLMSMIVANKWLRAGYGRKLRGYLLRHTIPQTLVDFGHSPIFPDADTFPCVPIFAKRSKPLSDGDAAPDGETFAACPFPRDDYRPDMPIGPYVLTRRKTIPTRFLRPDGWTLEDPRVQNLLEKIRTTGVPLKQFCGSSPLYGVKTGYNQAFYIDSATRERLIREDKRSAAIIKPLLRGRDIDRWRPKLSGMFIIFTRRGTDIDRYKAVKKHLEQFREPLESRAGEQAWYELQASPGEDFCQAMFGRKIVYQEIQFHSWFALDTSGACANNKVFLLPCDDLALLGVMCSPLMWWFLTRSLPHMKDEALNPAGFLMQGVRVTTGTDAQAAAIRTTVEPLLRLTDERHLAGADAVPEPAVLRRQLELEQRVAALVEDAYGLTEDERRLLRETRPVRDPLDVLEAKLAGRAVVEPEEQES